MALKVVLSELKPETRRRLAEELLRIILKSGNVEAASPKYVRRLLRKAQERLLTSPEGVETILHMAFLMEKGKTLRLLSGEPELERLSRLLSG